MRIYNQISVHWEGLNLWSFGLKTPHKVPSSVPFLRSCVILDKPSADVWELTNNKLQSDVQCWSLLSLLWPCRKCLCEVMCFVCLSKTSVSVSISATTQWIKCWVSRGWAGLILSTVHVWIYCIETVTRYTTLTSSVQTLQEPRGDRKLFMDHIVWIWSLNVNHKAAGLLTFYLDFFLPPPPTLLTGRTF